MQQKIQLKQVSRRIDYLMILVALLVSLFLTTLVYAEKSEVLTKKSFKVTNLPGLSTKPDFKQYAGYLTVDKKFQDNLFFWMFESQSSPQKDPLLIWLSGGPGCSSIAAMFEENGPFKLERKGKAIQLKKNPYSWNAKANIIYLDQPVGTGMSYSDTETFTKNQYEVSKQFYEFLKQFYKVFPEYQKNPLFITGESYAGHMIPGIANYILDQEGKPDSIHVNLQGLAIGNGWIDPMQQREVFPDVFYAAGLIDANKRDKAKKLFKMAVENGGAPEVDDFGPGAGGEGYKFPDMKPGVPCPGLILPAEFKTDSSALALKKLLDKYTGKNLNASLSLKDFIELIDIVGNGPEGLRKLLPQEIAVVFLDHSYAHLVFQFFLERLVSYTEHSGNYVNLMDALNYGPTIFVGLPLNWPADDAIFQEYMDMPEVRAALNTQSYPHEKTQPCNAMVSYVFNYINSEFQKSFLFVFPRLLSEIPVLFYNGQNDMICSPMGTREFLMQIAKDPLVFNFPGKAEYSNAPYVPWVAKEKQTDSQTSGGLYENRYGYYKRAGNLHFLNVLDASHMVPLSKPEAAQILINDFIHKGKIITD